MPVLTVTYRHFSGVGEIRLAAPTPPRLASFSSHIGTSGQAILSSDIISKFCQPRFLQITAFWSRITPGRAMEIPRGLSSPDNSRVTDITWDKYSA